MPPLRSHKKSRFGCLQCKQRRVKCDESGPPCGSCTFRKVECIYPNSAPTTTTTEVMPSSQAPHPPQSQPARHPQSAGVHDLPVMNSSNVLSVELMHKFSTETYKTICADPADSIAWQVRIPQRALQFPFLLDGLLSVAALHTAATKGAQERASYVNIAIEFQTRSLEPFQQTIRNISQENCDAVFAHSIFTIIHGIVVPDPADATRAAEGPNISNQLETIFVLFELVQGTAEITKMFGQSLQKTFPVEGDYWAGLRDTLDEESNEAFGHLHEINYNEHGCHLGKFQTIKTAISQLKLCYQRYHGRQDPASVLTWPAIVGKDFVTCLSQKDPLPLLILVHWGFLLGELDGKAWWATRSGLALVNDGLASLNQGSHLHFNGLAAAWLAYRNILASFSNGDRIFEADRI